MSQTPDQRTAASVRARLLNLSKERDELFDLTLARFALERFLYRLSQTKYRKRLILKGAMLFQLWNGVPLRPTRDLDLLATGDADRDEISKIVREIVLTKVDDDGIVFNLDKLIVQNIREDAEYGGVRATFIARLGSAVIPVQIDFGTGDAVTPEPVEATYPTMLAMPSPVLLTYPRETVVAEKLEAIVNLGMDNSRMKDYFDLWFLATTHTFDLDQLRLAVKRTFERRKQPLPSGLPIGLTDEFMNDPTKQRQWLAFQGRSIGTALALSEVVAVIRDFALPLFDNT